MAAFWCRQAILSDSSTKSNVSSDRFSTLSEEYQTLAISAFGQMACIGAQTLSRTSPPADGKPRGNTCSVCDAVLGRTRGALCEDLDIDPIYATIVNLLGLIQKQKLRRPRVAAMVATRRLLSHTKSHVHLDMSNSPLGPWCLQALNSSVRDLRIAAG